RIKTELSPGRFNEGLYFHPDLAKYAEYECELVDPISKSLDERIQASREQSKGIDFMGTINVDHFKAGELIIYGKDNVEIKRVLLSDLESLSIGISRQRVDENGEIPDRILPKNLIGQQITVVEHTKKYKGPFYFDEAGNRVFP